MKQLLWKTPILLLCFLSAGFYSLTDAATKKKPSDFVTIAILAKEKAHTLPLYLSCIENQTWPKNKTYLYIRTNNNTDDTAQILRDWVARVGKNYAKIYFDDTDVAEQVQLFGQHEWNYTRLKVICTLRQESFDWAYKHKSHYFVADCDNFIAPDTIQQMFNTKLPIVAPILYCTKRSCYSNYHYAIDVNGYYAHDPLYFNVLNQQVRGLIEVPVVHCTYFVRKDVIDKLTYDDLSARYDYVIFSHSARQKNIPQYLDNRKFYGYLTFAESAEEFAEETPLMDTYLLP